MAKLRLNSLFRRLVFCGFIFLFIHSMTLYRLWFPTGDPFIIASMKTAQRRRQEELHSYVVTSDAQNSNAKLAYIEERVDLQRPDQISFDKAHIPLEKRDINLDVKSNAHFFAREDANVPYPDQEIWKQILPQAVVRDINEPRDSQVADKGFLAAAEKLWHAQEHFPKEQTDVNVQEGVPISEGEKKLIVPLVPLAGGTRGNEPKAELSEAKVAKKFTELQYAIQTGQRENEVDHPKPHGMYQHPEQRIKDVDLNLNHPEQESRSPEALRKRALSFSNNSTLRRFLDEQHRRASHLASACRRLYPLQPSNVSEKSPVHHSMESHLLIDWKNQIAFCPVFKSASTSWIITFLNISGNWRPDLKLDNLMNITHRTYPKLIHSEAVAESRSMTRFMVVRHPFDRLVSCYRDKFESATKPYYYNLYGEQMIRTYRQFDPQITSSQDAQFRLETREEVEAKRRTRLADNPYTRPYGPTFTEFVKFVLNTTSDDAHWRPYDEHCQPCDIRYDFILRFNMYEEGKQFLEYINKSSVELRWDNPTRGQTTSNNSTCSYFKQLSPELVTQLVKKYHNDFEIFEYKPDEFLECIKT